MTLTWIIKLGRGGNKAVISVIVVALLVIVGVGCLDDELKTDGTGTINISGGGAGPSPTSVPLKPPSIKPDKKPTTPPPPSTELTTDPLKNLLIISTLDGTLTAIDRFSGERRWISKDTKPMIQVPLQQASSGSQEQQDNSQQTKGLPKAPYFLPDPKTGSLYMMGKQRSLRKLPFTIPELVSRAPCRSSEGLMYTGKKLDSWIMLNPFTGELMEMDMSDETCPASPTSGYCTDQPEKTRYANPKSILIGKTEYSLSMMEGSRKWNVTYHHYSATDMTAQSLQDYDLVHFTSPSEGHVLTYDRNSGELLWQTTLLSPVIGLYSIEGHTNLFSVPFNPIASDTLNRLRDGDSSSQKTLNPTTYVGECKYGLYAVPALADEKVLVIGDGTNLPPLLAGPGKGEEGPSMNEAGGNHNEFLLLGYYQTHESGSGVAPQQQIESAPSILTGEKANIIPPITFNGSGFIDDRVIPIDGTQDAKEQHDSKKPTHKTSDRTPVQFPPPLSTNSNPPAEPKKKIGREVKIVFTSSIISIAVTSAVFGILFMLYRRHKNNQLARTQKLLSSSDSGGVFMGDGGSNGSGSSGSRLVAAILPDGTQDMTIGKINFSPSQVLGKGCEGTFVFRGQFEGRDVAVKRILPECFAFADREVDLLKESDQHQNVIRYFCTETDGQFRYIALELCVATLSDWVEGRYENSSVDGVEVLKEATEGLAYLHSLRIVHRDVKPANVLLSESGGNGTRKVRTLISDFGLCKKIQSGRMSYSRRSGGVPGTDGWIAPEVIEGEENSGSRGRMTYAVDIFSMGCVFYYVLSKGDHPFGNAFRRQSNILMGEHDLSKISEEDRRGVVELIGMMISMNPEERPPLDAVLKHPIFWSSEKVLSFFLDVSDRIEKESEETFPLLRRFEDGGGAVVKGDWRDHICAYVAMDLRKYRTYKGGSVRDLLRALRNKKNHYRELEKEAQASLGDIPDEFVRYWVGRFPALLSYTWGVCEALKKEGVFGRYYHADYDFNGNNEDAYVLVEEFEGDNVLRESAQQNTLGKDFWKSKSQAKYQRWRRGASRGSPRKYQNNIRGGGDIPNGVVMGGGGELSASTDNYWRARDDGSRSPARREKFD